MSRPSSALKLCCKDGTRTIGQQIWKKGYAKNAYKTMVNLMIFGVASLQDVLIQSSNFIFIA